MTKDDAMLWLCEARDEFRRMADEANRLLCATTATPAGSMLSGASKQDQAQREVLLFLHGAAPLEGVWFGDMHPTERGAFWWRKRLTEAFPAIAAEKEQPGSALKGLERL
jgi:hypothetical protein